MGGSNNQFIVCVRVQHQSLQCAFTRKYLWTAHRETEPGETCSKPEKYLGQRKSLRTGPDFNKIWIRTMQFAWDDANRNHWKNAAASKSLNFDICITPKRLRCCAPGPHKRTQTDRPACPSSAFLWDPCIPAASPAYFHEYDKHGQAACWWRECGVTKANLGNIRTCAFMLIMRQTRLAAMSLKVVRVCRLSVSQQHQDASYLQRHCLCDQRRRRSALRRAPVPDYFVNRVPQKLRGYPGKIIAHKLRNNCQMNGRDCGCIGTVGPGPKCAQCVRTNTNAQIMYFWSENVR